MTCCHVAFKFFDVRIPHVGLMRGDKGDQKWPRSSVPLAIAPFRPERSSKALLDSPEPATQRGTRRVLSCLWGNVFFEVWRYGQLNLYSKAAARTFGSNWFHITNCGSPRVDSRKNIGVCIITPRVLCERPRLHLLLVQLASGRRAYGWSQPGPVIGSPACQLEWRGWIWQRSFYRQKKLL